MKHLLLLALLLIALIAPQSILAGFVQLNFNGATAAAINFDGARHFAFVNPTFVVSGISAGPTSLVDGSGLGKVGSITGTYTIGSCGACTTTTVSGSGTLSIADGTGHDLTADVNWVNISQGFGASEGLNLGNVINLTNIAYSGQNNDLLAFANVSPNHDALANMNWTTVPDAKTIEYLATNAFSQTSFSGTLYATPEPGFYGALAAGFSGLFLVMRRKRA